MFSIKYRITQDIKDIQSLSVEEFEKDDIAGFIKLQFNENSYGYYHDTENTWGEEYLTKWFEYLVETIQTLNTSNYVAISDTESYNSWIEITRQDKYITVNNVYAEKIGLGAIVTSKLKNVKYAKCWKETVLPLNEFKKEVQYELSKYIDEITKINPNLIKSSRIKKLELIFINI